MEKISRIISGIFGRKGKKETPTAEEEDITDIIKDKFTASLVLKLDALASGFDIIEAESNAGFARGLKRAGIMHAPAKKLFVKSTDNSVDIFDENVWDKITADSVDDIRETIKKVNELKTKKIQYDENEKDNEYNIDYSGIAREFTELLNRERLGDAMVHGREKQVADIYFNGNTERVQCLKNLCGECYERVITSDWDGVIFWRKNENIDDAKINEMENIFDSMAEECCNRYGKYENKVIPFPTAFTLGDK
jgi:hypothetical protein